MLNLKMYMYVSFITFEKLSLLIQKLRPWPEEVNNSNVL